MELRVNILVLNGPTQKQEAGIHLTSEQLWEVKDFLSTKFPQIPAKNIFLELQDLENNGVNSPTSPTENAQLGQRNYWI